MSKKQNKTLLTPEILKQALIGSVKKLDPRYMMKNPVMFVVEIGFVISLVLSFAPGLLGDTTPNARVYNSIVSAILFVTVLFANFAVIWSTNDVLRPRSTGMPPTALKINPSGKKNHSFFIMKYVFRPIAP